MVWANRRYRADPAPPRLKTVLRALDDLLVFIVADAQRHPGVPSPLTGFVPRVAPLRTPNSSGSPGPSRSPSEFAALAGTGAAVPAQLTPKDPLGEG